ncbi:STAS domain-containing protein [Streptomyces sp. NPDC002889]|uniref:STAS domain-containing protein n=1 Tax=Streptomyces sp. NPDC002889 TaxID=3364669 RepID=UPI0036917644
MTSRSDGRDGSRPRTASSAAPPLQPPWGATACGPRLAVTVTGGGREASLAVVVGEIDIEGASDLLHALTAALRAGGGLDLDLAGVTFCDSSGLHALLEVRSRALASGRTVALRNAGSQIRRLMEVTGTLELLAPDILPPGARAGSGPASLCQGVRQALADAGFQISGHDDEEVSGLTVQAQPYGVLIGWTEPTGPSPSGEPGLGHEMTAPYPGIHKALSIAVLAALTDAGFVMEHHVDGNAIVVTGEQPAELPASSQRPAGRGDAAAPHERTKEAAASSAAVDEAIGINSATVPGTGVSKRQS